MDDAEEQLNGPGRPAAVPAVRSRTLRHPSLMPLYAAAHLQNHRSASPSEQTASKRLLSSVQTLSPDEVFYIDPTMSRGSRISNQVGDLKVLTSLRLNTPPPLMTSRPAPPNLPDPFRAGLHPLRELGSAEWLLKPVRDPAQPNVSVVQLTQDEDQAITTLLKLHHQERASRERTPPEGKEPQAQDGPPLGAVWSDVETEAADTLLRGFVLGEEADGKVCEDQRGEDLAPSSEVQSMVDLRFCEDSAATDRKPSDSEGDAVHVLLRLGDAEPF